MGGYPPQCGLGFLSPNTTFNVSSAIFDGGSGTLLVTTSKDIAPASVLDPTDWRLSDGTQVLEATNGSISSDDTIELDSFSPVAGSGPAGQWTYSAANSNITSVDGDVLPPSSGFVS